MSSYAEVEAALARLFGADASAQKGAFRGRLKHFQRLGLPTGDRPGKGKRIDYSLDQIWQLAIALELAEFGMDPTDITQLVFRYWALLFRPWLENFSNKRRSVLVVSTRFMSGAWQPVAEEMPTIEAVGWVPGSHELSSIFGPGRRRGIVVDVGNLLLELSAALEK